MTNQTCPLKLLYVGIGERYPPEEDLLKMDPDMNPIELKSHTFYPKFKRTNAKPHRIISKKCTEKYQRLILNNRPNTAVGITLSGHGLAI